MTPEARHPCEQTSNNRYVKSVRDRFKEPYPDEPPSDDADYKRVLADHARTLKPVTAKLMAAMAMNNAAIPPTIAKNISTESGESAGWKEVFSFFRKQ